MAAAPPHATCVAISKPDAPGPTTSTVAYYEAYARDHDLELPLGTEVKRIERNPNE